MYMYECICMHVRMDVCMYVCIYTLLCVYICMYTWARLTLAFYFLLFSLIALVTILCVEQKKCL